MRVLEQALIDVLRILESKTVSYKVYCDVEVPWAITPPGLYPTVHIVGTIVIEEPGSRLITITLTESV